LICLLTSFDSICRHLWFNVGTTPYQAMLAGVCAGSLPRQKQVSKKLRAATQYS
jgi:hypothetical protein